MRVLMRSSMLFLNCVAAVGGRFLLADICASGNRERTYDDVEAPAASMRSRNNVSLFFSRNPLML
jgi:hypothetical protein